MMTMKRLFGIYLMLAVAVAAVGCYNDFDEPHPLDSIRPMTDEDFDPEQYRTIQEVKQLFIDQFGSISNTGDTGSWGSQTDLKATPATRSLRIEEDIYIKGKVITSDEEGNFYRSLYISDETGGIELKLGTGLYISYPMGTYDPATQTIPTHYVYVRLQGLYLGNYRMMLSIGDGPTDSFNKVREHKFYSNSNIEDKNRVKEHVFLGPATDLTLGHEILEINESNYNDFFCMSNDASVQANQDKLGRLVLVRGVTCHYSDDVNGTPYPSWLDRYLDPENPSSSSVLNATRLWYRWGFNDKTHTLAPSLYGSVLFSYGASAPSATSLPGVYVVRTSGYSRFASRPIVRDGAKGDILGVLTLYSKTWTYGYGAYQLAVSRFQDLLFAEEDFLSDEEVKTITPNGWTDNIWGYGEYDESADSYYPPSTVLGDVDGGDTSFVE